MKKYFSLLILSILFLGVGCSSGQDRKLTEQQKKIDELTSQLASTTEKIDSFENRVVVSTTPVTIQNLSIQKKIAPAKKAAVLNPKNSYYDQLNIDLKKTCNMNLVKEPGTNWDEDDVSTLYILLKNCDVGNDVKEFTEETGKTPFQALHDSLQ